MIIWWTECSKDLKYNFRNIIHHFTVTFDWFNASLLYKSFSALSFSLHLQVLLGFDSSSPEAVEQWRDSMSNPEKVVMSWHRLSRL